MEGPGEALCYPSPRRDAPRQAGRSHNDEEIRNSEKRGERRRERNPDLLRQGHGAQKEGTQAEA